MRSSGRARTAWVRSIVTTALDRADGPALPPWSSARSPLDLPPTSSLLDLLPADRPVTWLRRGDGLVGWGGAAEIRTAGATRFTDADKWWSEITAHAVVRDDVNEPGTGLVCFGSFAFADEPGQLGARRAGGHRRSPRRPDLADDGLAAAPSTPPRR